GNTILLVSHDMGVHFQITTKMLIMYAAKVVEYADTDDIFQRPLHPYTVMLTNSLPTIGDDRARHGLPGRPPSLWEPPQGCRFAPRCPLATDLCRQQEPRLTEHGRGHFSACHYAEHVLEFKQTLQAGPKLSEIAHDPSKLIAGVESAE
ncbi:MAG: ABC transporter ATP-binding protein, partial [Caldilineaceae bacterium]|nr:ABC transporter ATP-binding protein [Caldilineaceae bacterium]